MSIETSQPPNQLVHGFLLVRASDLLLANACKIELLISPYDGYAKGPLIDVIEEVREEFGKPAFNMPFDEIRAHQQWFKDEDRKLTTRYENALDVRPRSLLTARIGSEASNGFWTAFANIRLL